METQGERYISYTNKKEDYVKLDLNIKSSDEKWHTAIEIFKERIEGRYLNQIRDLRKDCNKNGFTIMAINCLLIDALLQFENGLENTIGNVQTEYEIFLTDRLNFSKNAAEIFYECIRCGILHSAQTYGNAVLTTDEGYVFKEDNNALKVSVNDFSEKIDNYFSNYIADLENPNKLTIRRNFIEKMKYVCKL